MFLQIEYLEPLDIESITSFFNIFATSEDKLSFKQRLSSSKKRKKSKIDNSLEQIIIKLDKKEEKEFYNILVGPTSVSSFFNFSDFFSFDEVPLLVKRHIAYHFGYSECKCGGFTVKDKDNKKIQVEEIIYIKNDNNFTLPESLNFVKSDRRNREDVVYKAHEVDFKTSSTILYSILSCKEVHFKSNEISYFLKRNDKSYVIYCEKEEETLFSKINLDKETQLSDFLKNNNNKEISNLLNKMYVKKDLSVLASFLNSKKKFEKDLDFLWEFLCVVPFFKDNRDLITEKLNKIYEKLDHKKQIKRRGEYLEIRERRYVDTLSYGSLKRFYYT